METVEEPAAEGATLSTNSPTTSTPMKARPVNSRMPAKNARRMRMAATCSSW